MEVEATIEWHTGRRAHINIALFNNINTLNMKKYTFYYCLIEFLEVSGTCWERPPSIDLED